MCKNALVSVRWRIFQKNPHVYHGQRFHQLIYRSRQLSRFNDVKKVRANFCETIDSRALSARREKNMKFLAADILWKYCPVSVVTIYVHKYRKYRERRRGLLFYKIARLMNRDTELIVQSMSHVRETLTAQIASIREGLSYKTMDLHLGEKQRSRL